VKKKSGDFIMTNDKKQFVQACIRRIADGFKPVRIILFGSYAYGGKTTADSDLDLLVVKQTRLPFAERIRRINSLVGAHVIPMDIIVLTPGEVERRRKGFDPFLEEALTKGQIVYEQPAL
jgi:predicted nucleotidyltransferase